ncbi:hypothetical protein C241_05157 [Bradyrhizobium lupini HPC(L)]|uniref:Uncharacterized protein n=1 Tax=Bradyrhizobium lupini HPC(L) TaxID=1229491 RepID=A0ABP2RUW0_RHILU|nr:hypothetical protein C241_05157 [Bradyrhizobium lupini HPC(L)]
MQRVESDVRAQRIKHGGDIAADIDTGDLVALAFQSLRASVARRQADRPLRRKSTHKNSYVLAAHRYL